MGCGAQAGWRDRAASAGVRDVDQVRVRAGRGAADAVAHAVRGRAGPHVPRQVSSTPLLHQESCILNTSSPSNVLHADIGDSILLLYPARRSDQASAAGCETQDPRGRAQSDAGPGPGLAATSYALLIATPLLDPTRS
eukprot:1804875-Rhodomonas_salina.1